ncbi:MAG: hypothetical protein M1533_01895 [Candidatus Thermoplasmatota archaeon]|jgi:hypothetical protein|nr:hypothetical protein [Candidatus Thermoplasmatota archaeon]MCL5793866.1 hypothetical protein [Candidatus Thermoplasmatota archaeon]
MNKPEGQSASTVDPEKDRVKRQLEQHWKLRNMETKENITPAAWAKFFLELVLPLVVVVTLMIHYIHLSILITWGTYMLLIGAVTLGFMKFFFGFSVSENVVRDLRKKGFIKYKKKKY